jgi:hypothetical protein
VQGNFLGTDSTGSGPNGALGNGNGTTSSNFGIELNTGASFNAIGGAGAGNFVANSGLACIMLDGDATSNVVQGNSVGVDKNGNPAPNLTDGLDFSGMAASNLVGESLAGQANVISENTDAGVTFYARTTGNVVEFNSIGVGFDSKGQPFPEPNQIGPAVFFRAGAGQKTLVFDWLAHAKGFRYIQGAKGTTNVVAQNIRVSSLSANQEFVALVYQDLLGRPAGDTELAAWGGLLDMGVSRSQVVLDIETAPGNEYYTHLVKGFYQAYLRRAESPSDDSALVSYLGFLAAGGSVEQVRAMFVGSAEYFDTRGGGTNAGFLSALYQDVLTRSAGDTAGVLALLNARALTRQQVAAAVFTSSEFRLDLVQVFFQHFLDRTGSAAELFSWAGLLQGGASEQQLIAALLGTQEYFDGATSP